jgi:CHAD domain-containing protein
MKQELLAYWTVQMHNIDKYIDICVQCAEAETVHQLRVSIKKLKAVFKLIEHLSPKAGFSSRKHLKNLGKLFRLAGILRDTQVQIELIGKIEAGQNLSYDRFVDFLGKKESESLKKFYNGLAVFGDLHELEDQYLQVNESLDENNPEKMGKRTVRLFNRRFSRIDKLLANSPGDKELHKTRMLLKQIRFLLSALKETDIGIETYIRSIDRLHAIELILGNWHDCVVMIDNLGRFMKGKMCKEAAQKEKYRGLIAFILDEKAMLLDKFNKAYTQLADNL